MPTVVFTGKGIDPATQRLRTRKEWTDLAYAKGFQPADKIGRFTDYLVASRHDTSKADDARRYGIKVITYEEFEAMLRGHAPISTHNSGGPALVIEPVDTTGMEEIEGWGSF
ncbi:MAG: hypothetical protein KGR26_06000 [Cyanobacteria bacterium REEB65]|nr:hypothetical protein [Cyanobacteria bacterium REEB65]